MSVTLHLSLRAPYFYPDRTTTRQDDPEGQSSLSFALADRILLIFIFKKAPDEIFKTHTEELFISPRAVGFGRSIRLILSI